MRNLFLTLSLILLTVISFSQELIQENKKWNVVNCSGWGDCWTEALKISGDTIINQINYKKLLRVYDTTFTNWNYYGALRENDGKVFYIFPNTDEERLIYDFDLPVGETFYGFYYDCPIEMTLQSIDTITTLNGEQKERYTFDNNEQWIKGIGSLNGLINVGVYWCMADVYYGLSCCFENEEQIYQSDDYDNCIVTTVGINENNILVKHSLYPNPFSNSSTLKFDYTDSQEYTLQIINQNAQIIETIENIKSGEIEIRKGKMKKGLYYYRLQTKKGIIASGKIIVN